MALVELHLGAARDRGDDSRAGCEVADRGDAAAGDAALTDRKCCLRGCGERVAAQFHGCRACVRGLARERDQMPLDPDCAADR